MLGRRHGGYLQGVCAEGYGDLCREERVRIVNPPLNARLVSGALTNGWRWTQRVRLEIGPLSQADGHILYIDKVNMLAIDRRRDSRRRAQGHYTVRRGPQATTARFLLVG